MVESIYATLIKRFPEWDQAELKSGIQNDIKFILIYAEKEKSIFESFIIWQKELLQSIDISDRALTNLLQVIIEHPEIELPLSTQRNINAVLQGNLPVVKNDQDISLSTIVSFHTNLFREVDPSSSSDKINKLEEDLRFVLYYLDQSALNKDLNKFDLFVKWHANLLAAIGIPKLSLVRMLVSLSVFQYGEHKQILHTSIDKLINNKITSLPEDHPLGYAGMICDAHIELFQDIDAHSKMEFKVHLQNDAEKHLQFLDQAISANSEVLFVEYIGWVKSTLNALKIETITIIRFLVTLRMTIALHKPEGVSYIDKAIRKLMEGNVGDPNKDHSYLQTDEARTYLSHLIDGNRKQATNFILELVEKKMPIRDIYIDIFQATQYEIGRLWEKNQVSVAQEHFCTATTQMIMSLLYPHIFSGKSNGKNVVATCVGSELHEIGIRMVADFLEMSGWNTYYIGANTPTVAIIDAIHKHQADMIALSVTLTPHIKKVTEIIEQVRLNHPSVKIMVGGYPFIMDPTLCEKVGADAMVKSAQDIHTEALKLIND